MEISTVIGLICAFLSLGVGMWLKGADPHVLINPAAFLIIVGGTVATLFNAFPMTEMKKFGKFCKLLFNKPKFMPKQEIMETFIAAAKASKQEGTIGIEKKANEVADPFIRSSLMLVADGFNAEFIAEVLESEIKQKEERHRIGAQMFAQGGMYAPTLGVLGAVIGLIAALGNLSDINMLGHSIAAAFVATLLGIFTGYVIWHPFSNKLKQLSAQEIENMKMIMEGTLTLQSGVTAMAIEAKLQTFIPSSERKSSKDE